MRGFKQAEGGAVAQHGFVEDLEEVDPDEDGEDDFVGLAADALVLIGKIRERVSTGLGYASGW